MSPISSRKRVPPEASRKRPARDGHRSGEGPALVAEELALQQIARDRRRVHRHEGSVGAGAGRVDGARHQLLSGAALAGDQHGHVPGRHPADGLEDLQHRGRLPHQLPAGKTAAAHFAAQLRHLALEVAGAQHLGGQGLDLVDAEGLDQVVQGPALHRLDGVVEGVLRRDDHHRGVEPLALDLIQQLQAAGRRHADVEEGQRVLAAGQLLQGGLALVHVGHLAAEILQRLAQHEADRRLVVGDQHPGAAGAHAGSRPAVPSPAGPPARGSPHRAGSPPAARRRGGTPSGR